MSQAAVGTVILEIPTDDDGHIDEAGLRELGRMFAAAERSEATRAIILTGRRPGIFVRSFSLQALKVTLQRLAARRQRYPQGTYVPERPWDSLFRRIENSCVPVIAAINGVAEGIGFELALACDYRVVERGDYTIGLPEVRIGALPGAGGTQRLPRLVGPARAKRIILFGEHLNPFDAYELGIADELVDDALSRAQERAAVIAASPAEAIASAKRLIQLTAELPLSSGLEEERRTFIDLLGSGEALSRVTTLTSRGLGLGQTDEVFPPPRTG